MSKRKNKKSSFFSTQFTSSCLSTTLVLVLLGTIVLFMLVARNLSTYVRENINVSVLVSDNVTGDSIRQMQTALAHRPYVRHIDYISKQQALDEEIEAMGTDPTEFIDYNPFTASFELKLHASYANNDSLTRIARELKRTAGVVDVVYQKDLIKSVNNNIRKISIILLIIAALFTYISFELINNTVRLTIFSRRFLINTMKLVGASWGFIRRPFLRQSLTLGIISAAVADALLYIGLRQWSIYEPELNAIVDWHVYAIVGGSVLVFGMLISYLCTFIALSKYLRMSSNDLYHV